MTKTQKIKIAVESDYLEEHSDRENEQHAFSYTITIQNLNLFTVQLLDRHWIIKDESDRITQEVLGEGVVGQQPIIKAGDSFHYTSGTIINSKIGSMSGSYRMRDDDGNIFKVSIPCFYLTPPHHIN